MAKRKHKRLNLSKSTHLKDAVGTHFRFVNLSAHVFSLVYIVIISYLLRSKNQPKI